jgi:RNA polymerase sigma-70 factor, ECF subfamily
MVEKPKHDEPSRSAGTGEEAILEVEIVSTAMLQSGVELARGGDLPSFERLYRENVDRIFALCLRLSGDPVRAEELTQDVFVRAWEKLDSFRGESAFSTWLHRLAVNVVLGMRRSEGRLGSRVVFADDLSIYESESGGSRPMDGERMDLEAAMASLPDGTRTVFVMHEVEGYTHEEIARLTGRAEGTCKALLHRARKLLRERLQ